jgi:hypothetical protein
MLRRKQSLKKIPNTKSEQNQPPKSSPKKEDKVFVAENIKQKKTDLAKEEKKNDKPDKDKIKDVKVKVEKPKVSAAKKEDQ